MTDKERSGAVVLVGSIGQEIIQHKYCIIVSFLSLTDGTSPQVILASDWFTHNSLTFGGKLRLIMDTIYTIGFGHLLSASEKINDL